MDRIDRHQELLERIHARLEELEKLKAALDDEWVCEDLVYRFWHHSFKVYQLQAYTERVVAELEALAPEGCVFDPWFVEIMDAGTGKVFELAHNQDWAAHTRPILEAFHHARFMLDMAVKFGRSLPKAPDLLPSGWAALLCLYRIR